MTRIAVLSDIHGNLPALEAVMADMESFSVDGVVVSGDIINGAPFSREVLELVLDKRWALIRGNHELYILDHDTPRCPPERQDWFMPAFTRERLGPDLLTVLAGLPDTISLRYPDARPVRVLHATNRSHTDAIRPDTDEDHIREMMAGIVEGTIIHGHNHVPGERHIAGWTLVNPGATGLTLDNDHRASYALLEGDWDGWKATFRRVPYDKAPIFARFEELNFAERFGYFGYLYMEEFRTAQTRIGPFRRWMEAEHPGEIPTMARALEFVRAGNFKPYTSEHFGRFLP